MTFVNRNLIENMMKYMQEYKSEVAVTGMNLKKI